MENQAGFDVERAVREWRDELGRRPGCAAADLQELEDHLRESVTALREQGLSAEEAVLLARRRLGDVASLDAEFSKVNAQRVWVDRALWMIVGVQAWMLLWDVGGLARMVTSVGLARTHVYPAAGWTGPFGWYHSLLPAALLAAAELAVLGGTVLAIVLWTRRRRALLSDRFHRALGRPSSSVFLAVVLLAIGLSVKFAMLVGSITLSRALPTAQFAAMMTSHGAASTLIVFGQVLTIPILLVGLARTRTRT